VPATADPVVDIVGLGKTYPGGRTALSDVTLRVDEGEIFGVVGESGAGKSTLLDLLTGTLRPSSGEVRVLGRDVPMLRPDALRAFRRELGVVFQSVPLLANRTVRQNVALPLRLRGRGRLPAEAHSSVDDMLRFVGLADRAHAFPAELSGGQRQRVGIARALVTRPRLLVCDEPTSSLDATTTDGVLELLRDARDRLGATVVVVTHDLEVVRAVCDRVALFERGLLRETIAVNRRGAPAGGSYRDRVRRVLGS
jgi:D-methionine transport system ATP-binding protein